METIITFGKYKDMNKTYQWIKNNDKNYYYYLLENDLIRVPQKMYKFTFDEWWNMIFCKDVTFDEWSNGYKRIEV